MQKYTKETSVGIFVFVTLLCVGYLTIKLGNLGLFNEDSYAVTAKFANVSGVRAGADVEMAGVPIGSVDTITLDAMTDAAVLTLRIQKDVELTEDVIASIKTSGLIGDKYVKLTQGGSPDLLADGDAITETESALDIESLISKYAFGDVEKDK